MWEAVKKKIVRTVESSSGWRSRTCWVLRLSSASACTGSVSRVSHGSRSALLAQLLQTHQHHAINECLKLLRQLGRAQLEAPMRHQHDHGQVQHMRMQLQKVKAMGAKTVLEPRLGVHLHLQQHDRLFRCAPFRRARPEDPIEAMVCGFKFRRLEAIERISRGIGP